MSCCEPCALAETSVCGGAASPHATHAPVLCQGTTGEEPERAPAAPIKRLAPQSQVVLTADQHSLEFHERTWAIRQAAYACPVSVMYEKEDLLIDDELTSSRSVGSPLVLDEDFGLVPVDDEEAYTSDGRRIVRIDSQVHASGRTTRRQMIAVEGEAAPGSGRNPHSLPIIPKKGDRRADAAEFAQLRASLSAEVELAQKGGAANGDWVVALRDARVPEPLPPLYIGGPALQECGRPDHVGEMRAERLRLNTESRARLALEFEAFAKNHGFTAVVLSSQHRLLIAITGPADGLVSLVAFPHMEEIEPRALSWSDADYWCDGLPHRFDSTVDDTRWECSTGLAPYLDTVNMAIGVNLYLNEGWSGGGISAFGGAAAIWALEMDTTIGTSEYVVTPHLAMGFHVSASKFTPQHFAFKRSVDGASRFHWGRLSGVSSADMNDFDPPSGTHDTTCAGIAMGDVTRGQDWRLSGSGEAAARSGVARDAVGVFGDGRLGDLAATFADGGYPVDIISSSISSELDSAGKTCRGVDTNSVGVLDAFNDLGVVIVKSAGNLGTVSGCQVGGPGASPALISVGAVTSERTANEIQASETIGGFSSGGRTGDGRAYPSIAVQHWSCGAAERASGQNTDMYDIQGATSGATPRIAGLAILFKHWYLAAFGSTTANAPGRLMVNILNMADGLAHEDSADSASAQVTVPYPGYGLGRFFARLFSNGGMSGLLWGNGCATSPMSMADTWILDIGDVPKNRRFVATLWWIETNTGEGESKARFQVSLSSPHAIDIRFTDVDPVVRFQYDCTSSVYDQRWHGALRLSVTALLVPKERRGRRRTRRTLYFAWYYEAEPWGGRILCTGERDDCPSIELSHTISPPEFPNLPHNPPKTYPPLVPPGGFVPPEVPDDPGIQPWADPLP